MTRYLKLLPFRKESNFKQRKTKNIRSLKFFECMVKCCNRLFGIVKWFRVRYSEKKTNTNSKVACKGLQEGLDPFPKARILRLINDNVKYIQFSPYFRKMIIGILHRVDNLKSVKDYIQSNFHMLNNSEKKIQSEIAVKMGDRVFVFDEALKKMFRAYKQCEYSLTNLKSFQNNEKKVKKFLRLLFDIFSPCRNSSTIIPILNTPTAYDGQDILLKKFNFLYSVISSKDAGRRCRKTMHINENSENSSKDIGNKSHLRKDGIIKIPFLKKECKVRELNDQQPVISHMYAEKVLDVMPVSENEHSPLKYLSKESFEEIFLREKIGVVKTFVLNQDCMIEDTHNKHSPKNKVDKKIRKVVENEKTGHTVHQIYINYETESKELQIHQNEIQLKSRSTIVPPVNDIGNGGFITVIDVNASPSLSSSSINSDEKSEYLNQVINVTSNSQIDNCRLEATLQNLECITYDTHVEHSPKIELNGEVKKGREVEKTENITQQMHVKYETKSKELQQNHIQQERHSTIVPTMNNFENDEIFAASTMNAIPYFSDSMINFNEMSEKFSEMMDTTSSSQIDDVSIKNNLDASLPIHRCTIDDTFTKHSIKIGANKENITAVELENTEHAVHRTHVKYDNGYKGIHQSQIQLKTDSGISFAMNNSRSEFFSSMDMSTKPSFHSSTTNIDEKTENSGKMMDLAPSSQIYDYSMKDVTKDNFKISTLSDASQFIKGGTINNTYEVTEGNQFPKCSTSYGSTDENISSIDPKPVIDHFHNNEDPAKNEVWGETPVNFCYGTVTEGDVMFHEGETKRMDLSKRRRRKRKRFVELKSDNVKRVCQILEPRYKMHCSGSLRQTANALGIFEKSAENQIHVSEIDHKSSFGPETAQNINKTIELRPQRAAKLKAFTRRKKKKV